MSLDEFALIERIARRTRARADIVLGIGDDAALLQPASGQQLAVTADTLNAGVHFPAESAPADIGWKALATNLSDLAAMGAVPAWCTLSLSLPQAEGDWLDAFADGLFALADASGIAVVGGDTTRGPLSISITAIGQLPAAQALRRDCARVGDDIWISGHPGDAAGALRLWQQDWRMRRPTSPMACSPTSATSPRAAAWPRWCRPMRCRCRPPCATRWGPMSRATARCAAATTTNCASPPRRNGARHCMRCHRRWRCR